MELREFRELYDTMVLPEEADKRILDKIVQENFTGKEEDIVNKRGKKTAWRTRIAAASLAAVLVVSGGAYAATQLWNSNVAEKFEVADNPEKMKEMSEKNFAQHMENTEKEDSVLSATDKDITVNVVQTLADRNSAYIYFEAEFGDQYTPVKKGQTKISDTGIAFAGVNFDTGGVDVNWSGGIAKIVNDHKIAYEYYFETAGLSKSLEDTEFGINIGKFEVDKVKCDPKPEVIAEGKWELKWNLSCGTESRIYTINKTVNIDGLNFKLKTLEISPLSYTLTAEADEWNKKDLRRYKKLNAEDGINVVITGLKLNDSVFKGFGGMGMIRVVGNKEPITLTEFSQFDKILDLDQLKGIVCVGGQKISLEDCSYSTVA